MQVLQEELRSTVLRIGLLDAQLPKLPEGKYYITGFMHTD